MDGYAFLTIVIVVIVFIGLPIGLGILFYTIPKRLGYPRTSKYLTIAYAMIVCTIAVRSFYKDKVQDRKMESAIVLADREAPLGWVYLRIFKDSSFEFESRGLERKGNIYTGKARITTDSILFDYRDSVPKAGTKAVYSDKFVAYTNGTYPEIVGVKLNKLKAK